MMIDEIYSWLMDHDPVMENSEIRMAWANLASYCYFINLMDFDARYRDKLKCILDKSHKFNIPVPDNNHQQVIELARTMNINGMASKPKQIQYE